MTIPKIMLGVALACASASAAAHPITLSASGSNPSTIQSTVDAFRASLGTLNSNIFGSFGNGRREINWDGVPDMASAPNNLAGNFFNTASLRGVVLSTPGSGLQVSANASVASAEFGNIDASYPGHFSPFSAQKLFTPLGSTITDVHFFIPGTANAALVNGFGVVFSDVDLANTTGIEFFDALDQSLGQFFAPSAAGSERFSFLGVRFSEGRIVSHARITSGNLILATGNSENGTTTDQVVMDDFIYGEPVLANVPEPSTLWLLLIGVATAGFNMRARTAAHSG